MSYTITNQMRDEVMALLHAAEMIDKDVAQTDCPLPASVHNRLQILRQAVTKANDKEGVAHFLGRST